MAIPPHTTYFARVFYGGWGGGYAAKAGGGVSGMVRARRAAEFILLQSVKSIDMIGTRP